MGQTCKIRKNTIRNSLFHLLYLMTKTIDGKLFLPLSVPKTFKRGLCTSASCINQQCLLEKGCSFVQNISSYEEAEFHNIVFDGNSYFFYSHNDYCHDIPLKPKWVKKPKTFRIKLLSDILEVLDYPVPRFSDGEWISGMGNIKKIVQQLDQEDNSETIQGHP